MAKKKKKSRKSRPKAAFRPKRTAQAKGASPIALCMIVKNEEKFLPGCLESVQGLVGEIVVVDTGSSDATREIATKMGARLYEYEWQDDFAAARNFALEKCRSPWVLYLDADERLHPEYHEMVLNAVRQDKADAFYLKVYSPVSGVLGNVPHIQAYPRLFKKLPGARFEGRIHEQISPSLKRLNARMEYIDAMIEHLGYCQEDDILKMKIKRNLKMLAAQIEKEPNNAYAYFQLGQTLLLDDQKEKGIEALQKALSFNILPNNLTATTLLMMANEYFEAEEYDRALEEIRKALELAPRQRLGYFLKSECLARKHDWEGALENLIKLNEYSDIPFSDISIEKTFEPYIVYQRWGLYAFNLKEYGLAFEKFTKYLQTAPEWRSGLFEKWSYAWQQSGGDPAKAAEVLKLFNGELDKFDDPASAARLSAGVAELMGDLSLMRDFVEQWLALDPENAQAHFYWGNLATEAGDLKTAEAEFRKALELGSDVWEVHYNLVVNLAKQKRYLEAAELLARALEVFPEKQESNQRLLAGLYGKAGQIEKMLELVNLKVEK
ncbi:MAG: hypothetical protein Kow0037_23610 [Calditrichia bacterium]